MNSTRQTHVSLPHLHLSTYLPTASSCRPAARSHERHLCFFHQCSFLPQSQVKIWLALTNEWSFDPVMFKLHRITSKSCWKDYQECTYFEGSFFWHISTIHVTLQTCSWSNPIINFLHASHSLLCQVDLSTKSAICTFGGIKRNFGHLPHKWNSLKPWVLEGMKMLILQRMYAPDGR